jgi:hypothetical protein
MKKILIGLALLGSFVFAEPMPEGSRQAALTDAIVEAVFGLEYTTCPPEQDLPSIQVACITNRHHVSGFYAFLDRRLIPTPGAEYPELKDFKLTPQSDDWIYHADSNRYERSFAFEDGIYRIIYAPNEDRTGDMTIFYTP